MSDFFRESLSPAELPMRRTLLGRSVRSATTPDRRIGRFNHEERSTYPQNNVPQRRLQGGHFLSLFDKFEDILYTTMG